MDPSLVWCSRALLAKAQLWENKVGCEHRHQKFEQKESEGSERNREAGPATAESVSSNRLQPVFCTRDQSQM